MVQHRSHDIPRGLTSIQSQIILKASLFDWKTLVESSPEPSNTFPTESAETLQITKNNPTGVQLRFHEQSLGHVGSIVGRPIESTISTLDVHSGELPGPDLRNC